MNHIENAIEQTRAAYERTGDKYDNLTQDFNEKVAYATLIGELRKQVDLSGKEVLDVGCGSGRLLQVLIAHKMRARGIDIAGASIARARLLGLSVCEGSMLELPYPDQEFDAVVSYFSLNCLPREGQHRALAEQYRVLRAGGMLAFACMHPTAKVAESLSIPMFGETFVVYPNTEEELRVLLRISGFRDVNLVTPPTPPCDIAAMFPQVSDPQILAFLEQGRHRPYALFVSARK